MSASPDDTPIERLAPFIGEWRMRAVFAAAAPAEATETQGALARTLFEWMPGRQFAVQRWKVPDPAAPDGLAIMGWDQGAEKYVQHYFDSRGIARLYEMSFADGVWKLSRTAPDFSPLDFSQRYAGVISEDGQTISGSWESSRDGSHWEHDFELIYSRIS